MRISPEAIYQALFIQMRGVLHRELVNCCVQDGLCAYLGRVERIKEGHLSLMRS